MNNNVFGTICSQTINTDNSMGYYVAFVDTDKPLKSFLEYEKKYCSFPDNCDTNDYHVSSEKLQSLFLELKTKVRPLNGEYAAKAEEVDRGEYLDAEYIFGPDAIWVELTYKDIERLYQALIDIAQKYGVTFFDAACGVTLSNSAWTFVTTKEFNRRNGITMWLVLALCIPLLVSLYLSKWIIMCCIVVLLVGTYFVTNHWLKTVSIDLQKKYRKEK